MKLLTQAIRSKLPPLGSTDRLPHDEIIVQAKFFTPDSSWSWYPTEFDGEDTLFGLVVGFEMELGYWSLSELEAARGPLGLPIERDRWFKPTPLSRLPEYSQWIGREPCPRKEGGSDVPHCSEPVSGPCHRVAGRSAGSYLPA